MENIINYAVKFVFAVLSVLITVYLVPWLKQKRVLGIIKTAVEAAEKLSENTEINKKDYVLEILQRAGVKVTPVEDAMIEACVKELDLVTRDFLSDANAAETPKESKQTGTEA